MPGAATSTIPALCLERTAAVVAVEATKVVAVVIKAWGADEVAIKVVWAEAVVTVISSTRLRTNIRASFAHFERDVR